MCLHARLACLRSIPTAFFFRVVAMILCLTVISYAQGNSWSKVRYNGGTLQTKVNPKDWDNHLTVTSELITFKLKDGQSMEIPPNTVVSLSYGQEAHRKVGTMVALGILLTPLALFGLFHKSRSHFIAIEYVTADEKKSALLLQGDGDNYRAILTALHGVTEMPIAVAEEDRKYVPSGAEVVAGNTKPGIGERLAAQPTGMVMVASTPDGADVVVDDVFLGNTPAKLSLQPGKHVVKLTLAGHKDWTKELTVSAGSSITLSATLEAVRGRSEASSFVTSMIVSIVGSVTCLFE